MPLIDLHHVAIRTRDLEATNRFYCDVLGMTQVHRPELGFPGSWLAIGQTMIHVMAGPRGCHDDNCAGAVDHIALRARDYDAFRGRLQAHGIDFRESGIADARIKQLFMCDPNGVRVELNFDIDDES